MRNEALDQTLQSGLEAYRSADYQQAAGHFGQYSQQNPDDLAARFYEAMSLMGSEQYVEAERQLENLRKNAGQYSTAVDWYLSLLYLRANDRALAISTLTELAKSSGFYADKATELLADLSGGGGGVNHLAD